MNKELYWGFWKENEQHEDGVSIFPWGTSFTEVHRILGEWLQANPSDEDSWWVVGTVDIKDEEMVLSAIKRIHVPATEDSPEPTTPSEGTPFTTLP